jgi:D-aminoacyl-tRNA deacylase
MISRTNSYNTLQISPDKKVTIRSLSSSSFRRITPFCLQLFWFLSFKVIQQPTLFVDAAMRIVVQRVKSGSVTVEGKIVSQIGPGIVALVGLHELDTYDDLQYCSSRLLTTKLWDSPTTGSPWRQNVKQMQYECLLVSQFTLYGTISKKNNPPDYKLAMKSIPARDMYQQFVQMVKNEYVGPQKAQKQQQRIQIQLPTLGNDDKIKDGIFGAMMDVSLVNDGPVTIIIESRIPENIQGNFNNNVSTLSIIDKQEAESQQQQQQEILASSFPSPVNTSSSETKTNEN